MGLFSKKQKPQVTIELSEKHKKLRIILLCCTIAIALGAFAIGITSLLSIDPGWYKIEVNSSRLHCGDDLVFNYYFDDEGTPTSEYRNVGKLYSELAADAYWLFYSGEAADGINNLGYLNEHPNEAVTIHPALYSALTLADTSAERYIYLAPIYSVYDSVCDSDDEYAAGSIDPKKNPEMLTYIKESLEYTKDPSHVSISFLGENKVKLNVSDTYLAYAKENGIEVFVDLSWMENAFIVDYIANELESHGYTNGYISSYDGFTRNLDSSGRSYALKISDRHENVLYYAADLNYSGETSIIVLKNYPLNEKDSYRYFVWSDGDVTSHYVDPKSGENKAATDNLIAYGGGSSCVELLLKLLPIYIADELDTDAIRTLGENGIYTVYCEETEIYTTGKPSSVTNLYKDEKTEYTLSN